VWNLIYNHLKNKKSNQISDDIFLGTNINSGLLENKNNMIDVKSGIFKLK